MNRVTLSGSYARTDDIITALYTGLGAPEWAGNNLDGLFDFLTASAEGPITINWHRIEFAKASQADVTSRVLAVLADVDQERDDLTLGFAL